MISLSKISQNLLESHDFTILIRSNGNQALETRSQAELLFSEHNRSEKANAVAGLPVPMGYDCVYDSACDSSSPFDFK